MDDRTSTPAALLEGTARALDHRLAVEQSRGRAPSMAAAVVRGGGTVWTGSRGRVEDGAPTPDTQYRIGSITKTFVAVLVLRLRDEGLLGLDDALGEHLPDAPVTDPTIAQLLAHSSGLAAETGAPWWERSDGAVRPDLASLVAVPPLRGPGRRHHYSNVGFALLGALVGQLRGRPWTAALQAEILDPLGMERTTYHPEPPHASGWAVHPWADALLPEPAEDAGLMAPAGQLWSTTTDLGRYGTFLLHGDHAVLATDTVVEMRVPSAPAERGRTAELAGTRPAAAAPRDPRPRRAHRLHARLPRHALGRPGRGPRRGSCSPTSPPARPSVRRRPSCSRSWPTGSRSCPPEWVPAAPAPELLALTGPWYWGAAPVALRAHGTDELAIGGLGGGARGSRFHRGPTGRGWGWTATTPARPCAWCGVPTAR